MLKRGVLTLILLLSLLMLSSSALTADYTDYHIYEGYPDLNWDITFLRVGYDDEQKEFITLIKFEQEYTTQIRATLVLNLRNSLNGNDLDVDVLPITNWPSTPISHNNQPSYGSLARSLIITPTQTSYTILLRDLPANTKGIALRAGSVGNNEKIITVESLDIGSSSVTRAVVATTTTTSPPTTTSTTPAPVQAGEQAPGDCEAQGGTCNLVPLLPCSDGEQEDEANECSFSRKCCRSGSLLRAARGTSVHQREAWEDYPGGLSPISLSCMDNKQIVAYESKFGINPECEDGPIPCGECDIGATECTVRYRYWECGDPCPNVAKQILLRITCARPGLTAACNSCLNEGKIWCVGREDNVCLDPAYSSQCDEYDGELIYDIEQCESDFDEIFMDQGASVCQDGTESRTCSSTQPLYCNFGNLVNHCRACGCPVDYYCADDGSCERIPLVTEITTCEQLQAIDDYSSSDEYYLMNDIDCINIYNFDPLFSEQNPFTGTFDGKGYEIKNLNINHPDAIGLFSHIGSVETDRDDVGIFSYVGDGEIKNLKLTNAHVRGRNNVGILVGRADGGYEINNLVENVYIDEASVVTGLTNVGGLVGRAFHSSISSSTSKASVSGVEGSECVGGLVGNIQGTTLPRSSINKSNYMGTAPSGVTGTFKVGGLVGCVRHSDIEESFAIAEVTCLPLSTNAQYIGGLVGYSHYGRISYSWSSGGVSCKVGDEYLGSQIGGLVGYISHSSVQQSYSSATVQGMLSVGGLIGSSFSPRPSIKAVYADGDVEGDVFVGGLIGRLYNGGFVFNSYASGDVTGNNIVGGLIGALEDMAGIQKTFATGNVSGNEYVGGLIGDIPYSSRDSVGVHSSYWDIETTGQETSARNMGTGIIKERPDHFFNPTLGIENNNLFNVWDFGRVWRKVPDSEPVLSYTRKDWVYDPSKGTFLVSDNVYYRSYNDDNGIRLTLDCPPSLSIVSYKSYFGNCYDRSTAVPCGSCTVGASRCSIFFSDGVCGDPCPTVISDRAYLELECAHVSDQVEGDTPPLNGQGVSNKPTTRADSEPIDRGLCTCDSQGNILTDECNLPNNYVPFCYEGEDPPICVCEEVVYTPTATVPSAVTKQESESCKSCIRAGKQWCGGNGVDECVILEDGQECLRLGGANFITNLPSCPVILKKDGEGCGDNSECDSGYCYDALCMQDIGVQSPRAKETLTREQIEARTANIVKHGTLIDDSSQGPLSLWESSREGSQDSEFHRETYSHRDGREVTLWFQDGLMNRETWTNPSTGTVTNLFWFSRLNWWTPKYYYREVSDYYNPIHSASQPWKTRVYDSRDKRLMSNPVTRIHGVGFGGETGYDLQASEYQDDDLDSEINNHLTDISGKDLSSIWYPDFEQVVLDRDAETGQPTRTAIYQEGRSSAPLYYLTRIKGDAGNNDRIEISDANNDLLYSANLDSNDGSFTGIKSASYFDAKTGEVRGTKTYQKRGDIYEVAGQRWLNVPGGSASTDPCADKCLRMQDGQYVPPRYKCIKKEVCRGDGVGKCVCEMEGDICKATFVDQAGEGGGCSV